MKITAERECNMPQALGLNGASTVLVVEDEVLISEMVSDVLLDQGFDVHVVSSGDEALRFIASGCQIDLLFTDINIDGEIDGEALAQRARELRPNLPIVFASGRMSVLDHLKATPGATCLPKPYNAAQLCTAVECVFATRQ
jgi:CheY-like chemotaxis protein